MESTFPVGEQMHVGLQDGYLSSGTPGDDENAAAIRIIPLIEFAQNLPEMFDSGFLPAEPRLRARISPVHPEVFLVCIDQDLLTSHRLIFPQNRGRVLYSRTVNQMNGLAYQLITRSLLMVVRVTYQVLRNAKWHRQEDFLVVIVNTKHPSIQPQLENALRKGLRSISRGKRYSVELNFDPLITRWMKSVFYTEHEQWKASCNCVQNFVGCWGGRIVITNTSEYEHCFDVGNPDCCCLWIFFPLCCLLMCPAYKTSRQILVDDHKIFIDGGACYWDLKNHPDQDSALAQLKRTFYREQIDKNEIFLVIQLRHQRELQPSREERDEQSVSSVEPISSQPQSEDGDLPSYEDAVLLLAKTNEGMTTVGN
ncbi:hypothetical protein HOLleu_19754 [Holothuria leucospilota]|uniref:Uncharacterized protein n=1 Tax=Holothuria leucospilota TaxID=206669 RepID=A0A9Q1BYU4_HOLLE|nr:hypothetical protein HOLleu_19754 [Holothuria leucospilota]